MQEIFWLHGDTNTYFHSSAKISRNRKQIKHFVSSAGVSISNPVLIGKEITLEFIKRFTSNQDCSFDSDLDFELIPCYFGSR